MSQFLIHLLLPLAICLLGKIASPQHPALIVSEEISVLQDTPYMPPKINYFPLIPVRQVPASFNEQIPFSIGADKVHV